MSESLPETTDLLTSLVEQLYELNTEAAHRRLLVLSGEEEWGLQQAQSICSNANFNDVLWLSETAPEDITSLSPNKAQQFLGGEQDVVIYNAFSGFSPDAFGAISGVIRAGGFLVLLTPPLDSWDEYPDPEYKKIIQYPGHTGHYESLYLARLQNIIRSRKDVVLIEQGESIPDFQQFNDSAAPSSIVEHNAICKTIDQQQAVDALVNVVKGHRRRPVVLSSDRGRGKSSALGIAAAQLLEQGLKKIIITAPRMAATNVLFEQAGRVLQNVEMGRGVIRNDTGEIVFMAPDDICLNTPEADLLLVDEAAGIPVPMLEKMLKAYSRIAFATTVHGYEGTGRGFSLRFSKTLARETPNWKKLTLKKPVRWAEGDPLESFVFDSLLLNASVPEIENANEISPETLQVEKLDKQDLVSNGELLNRVFGLLVLAHYRTRPSDLRRLLDTPDLDLFVMRDGKHVAGVLMTMREGPVGEEMAQMIYEGARRVHGHLIPQSMITHSGLKPFASKKIARIMRIAVIPPLTRKGVGRTMVEYMNHYYQEEGFDFTGVSFGATADLLHFWSSCGFDVVRIGFTRDASSGTHSYILLKALNEADQALLNHAKQGFIDNLAYILPEALSDIEPELLALSFESIDMPELEVGDRKTLYAFTQGHRGYDESISAIMRLVIKTFFEKSLFEQLDSEYSEMLVRKVLQKWNWEKMVAHFSRAGKNTVVDQIREAVKALCTS